MDVKTDRPRLKAVQRSRFMTQQDFDARFPWTLETSGCPQLLDHRHLTPQYAFGWVLTMEDFLDKYWGDLPDKGPDIAPIHCFGSLVEMWERAGMLEFYKFSQVVPSPSSIPIPLRQHGLQGILISLTYNTDPFAFQVAVNQPFLEAAAAALGQQEKPKWHRMVRFQRRLREPVKLKTSKSS